MKKTLSYLILALALVTIQAVDPPAVAKTPRTQTPTEIKAQADAIKVNDATTKFTGKYYRGVFLDDEPPKGTNTAINNIQISQADLAFSKDPTDLCWINMVPAKSPENQVSVQSVKPQDQNNMTLINYQQKPRLQSPILQTCWHHPQKSCCNIRQDGQVWPNYKKQFLKQCVNYNSQGLKWLNSPQDLRDIGCVSCYVEYNHLLIVNDGSKKYVDTVSDLMEKQLADTGVKRTLAGDYVRNAAFAEPGTYTNPNMNTFNSANGYFKICASYAMRISQKLNLEIKEGQVGQDVKLLGKIITEWDRCGIYDIWTTTLNSLPGTEAEYIRFPSRKFQDWLAYIEWWGLHNMSGYGFIIIDDLSTAEKIKNVTDKDCFKRNPDQQHKNGGMVTTPWVGLIAVLTILASLY